MFCCLTLFFSPGQEIPAGNVKQEHVDLGDDPVDEGIAHRESAEGRDEDGLGERGDALAELDQTEEQDSKFGILDEDDGGVDRDQWESSLMTKEVSRESKVFSS